MIGATVMFFPWSVPHLTVLSMFSISYLSQSSWLDLSDWRYVLTDWEAGECDTEQP